MITQFTCPCGNQDPKEAKHYDGAIGYEAIVCKKCGNYSDEFGEHEADAWSQSFVGLPVTKPMEENY